MFKSKHSLDFRDLLSLKKITCFVLMAWPITYCGRPNSGDDYDMAAANNNGERVSPLEHPSVVRITGPQGNICTGTLIGNNKVLSAGHCGLDHSGKDLNASGVRMDIAGQSYSPSAINVHPEYKKNFDPNLDDHTREKNDLAVFDLPPGARIPDNTARNFGQTASMGQNVTIAGYGHRSLGGGFNPSPNDPAGILRKGTNTVGKVNDGLIELTPSGLGTPSFQTGNAKGRGNIGPNSTQYDPTRTQGAPGDSGGPLFNNKGEIIGVASGAFYAPNNKGPNGQPNVDYKRTTSYIDLSHESNKKWIDTQIKGPGPNPAQAQVQAPAMRPVLGQVPGQVPGNLRPAPTVGPRPTPAVAPRPAAAPMFPR